ncbi:unnamed protein product [Phytophthora lilii]|uniref:Unnamed protein product n=1 Tax=Phytophthora lilii TaxID=2077276 RepID=A0A9W6YIE0_9STRA|nr:unnamed protein product [Phytophthora lilii]
MSNSPTRPLPPPRASGGDNDQIILSPLMTLMPTGYRNIQPFQKGKGWHTNGRTPRHRVASTLASDGTDIDQHAEKERGVVFPLLPGHENSRPGTQGPDASAVEGASAISSAGDQGDDRQEDEAAAIEKKVISPRAPSTPSTNGAPRRPSRTDIRVSSSNGGSFRSRALSGSPSNDASRPTSPATISGDDNLKSLANEETKAVPGPDPVLMQQLWQEYAARSHAANRQVDAAAYHEKMHRRYGEQRALKERISQLEQALETMENERNKARAQAENANKQIELLTLDRSTSELSESGTTSPTMRTVRSSFIKPTKSDEPTNAEEKSYRERSFALERALAQAKVSLSALQGQLRRQKAESAERTQALEAQLVLERNTSLELARQLREITAGFTRASAELVETRVNLEREQQRSREIIEQAQLQNAQLLSDTRRAQLETRMKLAVRSLGREALRHKMEALTSRTMRAEQSMRVAQLETERVCRERDATREQLEQVLSSHAIKYHSLGASGGIPGILKRSKQLMNASRMVSDQLLLLQVLYEEAQEPENADDGFSVHFVAYEPRSAQDDFLTFHLRDIKRLVPNHDHFLAEHSVRRRERLEALAELLLDYIHAGYKNGHLVLAEISGPEAATRLPREQLAAHHHTQQVTVYRGTRYLSLVRADEDDTVLVELDVTEAFAAATSQVWWLEIRAVVLGFTGSCDSEALFTKVDLRQLLTFCSTFASYRPSQSHDGGAGDDAELFAVHEALLEPLFESLQIVIHESGGAAKLKVVGVDEESRPSTSIEPQNRRRRLSVENQANVHLNGLDAQESKRVSSKISDPSTLRHQCVINAGDVFYCVRLQELWDGELLLDITMDDPETQQHFHRVLHEPQLAKLVEHLVADGALVENDTDESLEERKAAALQVKYGLSLELHRPLCKLVEKNVQPVLPHPSQISNKPATEAGGISLGALFDDSTGGELTYDQVDGTEYEMGTMILAPSACATLGLHHDREIRIIAAVPSILSDESSVYRLLKDILSASSKVSAESTVKEVRRQRAGIRFRGEAGYSLIQTISANVAYMGDVAVFECISLTAEIEDPIYLPLVLVVENPTIKDSPLQLVFEALGVDEDSTEFTRDALARSRAGSRADDLPELDAESAPP